MAGNTVSSADRTHLAKGQIVAAMVGMIAGTKERAEQRMRDLPAGRYDHYDEHREGAILELAGRLGLREAVELVREGQLEIPQSVEI